MSAGFKELVSNLQGNFTLIAVVLCQEKVQVKSELFLQHSIFSSSQSFYLGVSEFLCKLFQNILQIGIL